jgi:hypothetical protein
MPRQPNILWVVTTHQPSPGLRLIDEAANVRPVG